MRSKPEFIFSSNLDTRGSELNVFASSTILGSLTPPQRIQPFTFVVGGIRLSSSSAATGNPNIKSGSWASQNSSSDSKSEVGTVNALARSSGAAKLFLFHRYHGIESSNVSSAVDDEGKTPSSNTDKVSSSLSSVYGKNPLFRFKEGSLAPGLESRDSSNRQDEDLSS